MKLVLAKRWCAADVVGLRAMASLAVLGLAVFSLTILQPGARAQTVQPQARVISAPQSDKMATLRGNVHPFARPEHDRGVLPDQQPVTRMHMLLQRSVEQEVALQQLMADQLDSKSPRFHQWLTPQQFGEQFGPVDSDIQAVKDWLAAQGFTGMRVNNGKTLIEFNGTAGQIRNAFRTEIHRLNVHNEEHFANWSEPQIPAALAPVVAGVVGLHNFHPKPHVRRFGKFQRNARTGEISPLFTYTDGNGTFYGVGPADFAKIYNLPAGFNGSGVSIAIVGQTNINSQDVVDFRNIFGLTPAAVATASSPPSCPAPGPSLCIILNGPDPGLTGDEGESDLDVEWSGAVAQGANIIFVTSQFTETDGGGGVDASAEYIIDNNVAPIMSESYGTCEAALGNTGNQFYNALWQQGAAEGISIFLSAGDNGSAGCADQNSDSYSGQTASTAGLGVSGLASTPYNVAVGGTDFNQKNLETTYWNSVNAGGQVSAKGYIPEMPWNDSCAATGAGGCGTVTSANPPNCPSCLVAGSGGPSSVYKTKPAFQTGFGDSARDLPDVSLFSADGGNKSFYIVCQSNQDIPGDNGCNLTTEIQTANCDPCHDFQAVGGTSASAPAFAGIMALVVQKTGQRQGNPNVELYNLAKSEVFANCDSSKGPGAGCVFNDITTTTPAGGNAPNLNISVPCSGGSTNCSKTTSGGFGVVASSSTPAFTSTAGYDMATGLGSVNVTNLVNAWTTPAPTSPTVTITSGSINGTAGSSFTVTGSVTGVATPTGVVVLENAATSTPAGNPPAIDIINGAAGGPASLDASGNFSISTKFLPAGNYNLKAHYGGDSTHAAKDSASISVILAKLASKVVVSFVTFNNSNPPKPVLSTSSQSVQYGSDYILRADVENGGGTPCENASTRVVSFVCPTGSVSLLDAGQPLKDFPSAQTPNASNTARLNDRGFIEDQPIQLLPGAHTITATFAPDATSSYLAPASASNTLSVTITQATTTTAVVPSASIISTGGSITLTATVSSHSNSTQGPTGNVQFLSGGGNLGSAATCTPAGATTDSSGNFVGASCVAKLTTNLSSLPPGFFWPQPRATPFVIVAWLAALLALISFFIAMMQAARRRQFACAALILAAVAITAIAGCGGGGSTTRTTRTITAKYAGDTNYSGSTSSGVTITLQ